MQLGSGPVIWESSINLSDIVAILAFVVAAVTAVLAYRQYRRTVVTNQARFTLDLMQEWYSNTKMRKLYYKLDYGRWRFDPDSFPMSADEPGIDQILYMMDLISHLLKLGLLSRGELSIIKFEALRVLENPEIIKYLNWLDEECVEIGLRPGSIYTNIGELAAALREL